MPQQIRQEAIAHYDVAVIGTGFAGVAMGEHLRRMGVSNYILFEKADSIGGTWRDNTYPGCRCDVPSVLYSYSFAPEWRWTSTFPPQSEIRAYIERVARRRGILDRVKFNTEVVAAEFSGADGRWALSGHRGPLATCRVLVSAVGQLNQPSIPRILGAERFEGLKFHLARWRHDFDLTGKSVAVIGTGASAIQLVPAIAPRVKELFLFQRSPPWVFPKDERLTTALERLRHRIFPWGQHRDRARTYDNFEKGFDKYITDTAMNVDLRRICRDMIDRQIRDPALRERVFPTYTPGCKRLLASNEWYSALDRDNVTVLLSELAGMDESAAIDDAGNGHEVDAIIFATGFKSTQFLIPMTVTGLHGKDLHESWKGEPEAYLGVTYPDFPNFFMMYGPNTNTHNSIIFMLEQQAGYIARKVETILKKPGRYLNVKPAALKSFYDELMPKFAQFAWSTECRNWYRTATGKVVNNWPARTRDYEAKLRLPDDSNYEFVEAVGDSVKDSSGARAFHAI